MGVLFSSSLEADVGAVEAESARTRSPGADNLWTKCLEAESLAK